MAKIRNVSGGDLEVPRGFSRVLVRADEVLTVGDDELESYTCQSSIWADQTPQKGEK